MTKILVYTAIFGNYDLPTFSTRTNSGPDIQIDYFIINESNYLSNLEPFGVSMDTNALSSSQLNRLFKFAVHDDYDYSLYVDGNISFTEENILRLLADFTASASALGLGVHTEHNTLEQELHKCWILGKINAEEYNLIFSYLKDNDAFALRPFHNSMVLKRHVRCGSLSQKFYEHYNLKKIARDQFIIPILYRRQSSEIYEFSHKTYNFKTVSHNTTIIFKLKKRIRMLWRKSKFLKR